MGRVDPGDRHGVAGQVERRDGDARCTSVESSPSRTSSFPRSWPPDRRASDRAAAATEQKERGRDPAQMNEGRFRHMRRRGPLLLPRDEHPLAGRAPGDRAGDRDRPRGRTAARRRGRAARRRVRRGDAARPCHRGAALRRGPLPALRAVAGPHRGAAAARGPGDPQRQRRLRGLRGVDPLRPDARQAERLGGRPRAGAGAAGAGPGRAADRGHPHHRAAVSRAARRCRLPRRPPGHRHARPQARVRRAAGARVAPDRGPAGPAAAGCRHRPLRARAAHHRGRAGLGAGRRRRARRRAVAAPALCHGGRRQRWAAAGRREAVRGGPWS